MTAALRALTTAGSSCWTSRRTKAAAQAAAQCLPLTARCTRHPACIAHEVLRSLLQVLATWTAHTTLADACDGKVSCRAADAVSTLLQIGALLAEHGSAAAAQNTLASSTIFEVKTHLGSSSESAANMPHPVLDSFSSQAQQLDMPENSSVPRPRRRTGS